MYELLDRKCACCGKVFLPAAFHVYVRGSKYYCSWTCYNKADQKIKRHRGGHQSKAVTQYSLDGQKIRTYPSVQSAAKMTGISECMISRVCRNAPHRTKGFIFKYKDDERSIYERTDETDTE